MAARNKLVVPGSYEAVHQLKLEIASEFGVHLGPDSPSRGNGSVGGEMTKRLIAQAQKGLNHPFE